MKQVLDAHASLNPKPIEKLTPAEARQQPTIADAVNALLKQRLIRLACGVLRVPSSVKNYPEGPLYGSTPAQMHRWENQYMLPN